eukprot:86596_1
MVDFPGKSLIDRIIGLNDHMVGAGTLRPQDITKCLDVNAGAGDNVIVYPCHFGTNQKWSRGVPDADGFYTLVSQYNNECLDARDCNYNEGNQLFEYPGFAVQTRIISTYHNKCMGVNFLEGDNVYLHDCHGGNNQEWIRGVPDSDGYYQLISVYNNECLDAHPEGDGIINSGDNIYTYPCHGGDNQKWKIDGALIKNKANGGNKCVDGGDQGNNVHIWDCNYNSGNQLFEYPGMSSSASSALSIGNMLQMDDIQFMNADKSIESGKYLYILVVIGILLILINLIGFGIYFCKRNN